MNRSIRSLLAASALLIGSLAFAQPGPYPITISGQVIPCDPANNYVTITTILNTLPDLDIEVPLDSNCTYSVTVMMDDLQGSFQVGAACSGAMAYGTGSYQVNIDSANAASVVIYVTCGSNPDPCQACVSVVQDSSFFGIVPFSATFHSCSSGGTAPYTYVWQLPDGSTSGTATSQYLFPGPGSYNVCLTMADATGCTSVTCDSVYVDANGLINSNIVSDCLGVPNGPDVPGTECTDPLSGPGIWSAACICVADSGSTACNADFWVIQAYDSTAGGGVEPIPNEVWVWNLSSGGNGTYQFSWDFGDGTSSTDAYPTHEYAGPGPWILCLTMTSGNCTDTYCDSVSVDANGILNGMIVDGHSTAVSNAAERDGGFTLNVIQNMPTGIADVPAIAELKLWPNPVRDALNLTVNSTVNGKLPITVIDPSGRTRINLEHTFTTGGNTVRIPTETLEPGLYMVRIGNDTHSKAQRFIKVR